ncbi:hypothetical protein MHI24_06815 [Paenibacillus sp. FSL K6-1096]|uniref:hypothetical protein n=1 Tax=Paenibacillus sp. FSL K6-1096 TaxID=2921460 RepID=UPI0030EDF593
MGGAENNIKLITLLKFMVTGSDLAIPFAGSAGMAALKSRNEKATSVKEAALPSIGMEVL